MPLESCVFLCLQFCRLCRGLYCVGVLASIACIVQSASVCPVFLWAGVDALRSNAAFCGFYVIFILLNYSWLLIALFRVCWRPRLRLLSLDCQCAEPCFPARWALVASLLRTGRNFM